MSTHRAVRLGITVLSAVALVASGASPVVAIPVPASVAPLTTLSMPVRPAGLAVDSAGAAYVAGYGATATGNGTEVSVFEPASATRNDARTLTGLDSPWDVALSATGQVYVSNYKGNTISVFEPGHTTASGTSLAGVTAPTGLAFDNSGRLLVASAATPLVYVFAAGSTTPTDTIAVSEPAGGIAVDPLWNRLYVTHPRLANPGTGWVEVLDIATKAVVPGAGAHNLAQPMDVAFQLPSGLYFVSEWKAGAASVVRAYTRNTATEVSEQSLGSVTGPWGVAVSPRTGAVLVGDDVAPYHVRVYPSVVSSILGVDPASGPVTGGTVVSVNGTNLGAVSTVTFNGVAAQPVGPAFPGTFPVRVPAGTAAGPVSVVVTWGGSTTGLLNAFTYTPVAPGKATGVSGAPGKGQVTVSWTPPADSGGVPVASYSVTPTPGGPACATTATSCTIAGLTNGTKYRFVVRATNTAGLSSDSDASAEVAPYIPVTQKVKAKKASSKLPRKGFTTVVNWVKKPKYTSQYMKATCTAEGIPPTVQLCRIYSYKTGKIKVRTKGFRNVRVTITLQALTKPNAPVQYGPSTTWTRIWRVR